MNHEKQIRELNKEDRKAFQDGKRNDMDAVYRILEILREWNGHEDEKELPNASVED